MKIEVKKSWLSALILLALAAAAIVYLAGQFLSMREVEPIYLSLIHISEPTRP